MPRTKSDLGRLTRSARRKRKQLAKETVAEREARLGKQRIDARLRYQNETIEQREARSCYARINFLKRRTQAQYIERKAAQTMILQEAKLYSKFLPVLTDNGFDVIKIKTELCENSEELNIQIKEECQYNELCEDGIIHAPYRDLKPFKMEEASEDALKLSLCKKEKVSLQSFEINDDLDLLRPVRVVRPKHLWYSETM